MLLEDSFELCEKYISKCSWGLEVYIYIKCLLVLLTHVCWFRATGGYICGCGRPSNLVKCYCFQYSDRYHFVNCYLNCSKTTAPTFDCVMSVRLSDIDSVYLNNKAMATIIKSISNPPLTLWATFVPCYLPPRRRPGDGRYCNAPRPSVRPSVCLLSQMCGWFGGGGGGVMFFLHFMQFQTFLEKELGFFDFLWKYWKVPITYWLNGSGFSK